MVFESVTKDQLEQFESPASCDIQWMKFTNFAAYDLQILFKTTLP